MSPPPPPPPPPANFPASQQPLQFLSTALSQRGPSALPYAEATKCLIRQHLLSLLQTHHSLRPKISSFTHNDGRTLNLLHASGTLPILFSGVPYNIPASIWLLERYPLIPPSVFLNPTRDMIIKPNHPHVDRSGFVRVPYLKNWIHPSSNLVDLVRSLSQIFSIDPPLFSRQNPNPNPNPSEEEVLRRNAVERIVEMVHGDSARLRKMREGEMEGLLGAQAALRGREGVLARGVREMVGEKEGLEQMLQIVVMNVDVVEGWIRENGGRWLVDVGEDGAFEAGDDMSKRMLDCAAEDLAVEDTVYCLDRALQCGSIPFDVYLKNVRALSREQFFQRALATKVRAAQVSNMVGRASLYGS